MRPILLTTLAMLAFAANSILCRFALGGEMIDAASFTAVRLCCGAVTLALLLRVRDGALKKAKLDLSAVGALFIYAICFSFAYLQLSAGAGALILFGAVQLTMILFGLISGERPALLVWMGIVLATGGLVYLVAPTITAPSFVGALLMAVAGVSWGVYSLRGKLAGEPVAATAWNFIGAAPLALLGLLASGLFFQSANYSSMGILLAALSGAATSGIGYVIWYTALPYLSSTRAATVQLSVPVIAALGGVLILSEPVSLRLVLASVSVLGGIALTIKSKQSVTAEPSSEADLESVVEESS